MSLDYLDDLCGRRGWTVGIVAVIEPRISGVGHPLTVLEALEVRDDDQSLPWPKRDLIAAVPLILNTVDEAAQLIVDQIQTGRV